MPSPEEAEQGRRRLIEAADQRKLDQKTNHLEKGLKAAGVLDSEDKLDPVKSKYPQRIPKAELPPAKHHFSFPLSKEQLEQIVSGDQMVGFPLEIVINRLTQQNRAWLDPIGRSLAPKEAEGKLCQLVVETIDHSSKKITIQVLLPESKIWPHEVKVVDLAFTDMLSWWTKIKSFWD